MQLDLAIKFCEIAKQSIIQMWTTLSRRSVDIDRVMKYAVIGIG
jgi:hypothetical protein